MIAIIFPGGHQKPWICVHSRTGKSRDGGKKSPMKKIVVVSMLFLSVSLCLAEEQRYSVPLLDSPGYGPVGAPVTIVEFIDYQ